MTEHEITMAVAETSQTDAAPMAPTLSREELMGYSKRHLVDTVLSHAPHIELLLGDLAAAEMRVVELEGRFLELQGYADHATTELAREWNELRTSGLLWLINATTFHPRGFALGITYRDGIATGWTLQGDGTDPWSYADDEITAQRFRDAQATLASQSAKQDHHIDTEKASSAHVTAKTGGVA